MILAYDDRNITLNGKKVVSDTGGTYRASQRMIDFFASANRFQQSNWNSFDHHTAHQDQIQFLVHRNNENKILHTALVGEMNGLLAALCSGQTMLKLDEDRLSSDAPWPLLSDHRLYQAWIQEEPYARTPDARIADQAPRTLDLPMRKPDAMTGSECVLQWKTLSAQDRERRVLKEWQAGNVPLATRQLVPIEVRLADRKGNQHQIVYFVTSDVLSIGADDNFLRMPISPGLALQLAESVDCLLPTTKIVRDIAQASQTRVVPKPMTAARESLETFWEHQQLIDQQLKELERDRGPRLVSGHKKDVVLTNRLKEKAHRVAIFGWFYPDGRLIQNLYVGHIDHYVDYSHGIRLVAQSMLLDGRQVRMQDVLTDNDLCALLSDEGAISLRDLLQASQWPQVTPLE